MPRNDARYKSSFSLFPLSFSLRPAFTLAEILITLTIIGVVAAITIPVLNKQVQEIEYKTAYKKAYADISQAFSQAIQQQTLTPRSSSYDAVATASEWAVMKDNFKIIKVCESNNAFDCWADAERVCTGTCNGNVPEISNKTFIDASGRAWAQFFIQSNIYLLDTNGFKEPNKFGKDRWIFTLKNADNSITSVGLPAKVAPRPGDATTQTDWCTYPPCYYNSWLYN